MRGSIDRASSDGRSCSWRTTCTTPRSCSPRSPRRGPTSSPQIDGGGARPSRPGHRRGRRASGASAIRGCRFATSVRARAISRHAGHRLARSAHRPAASPRRPPRAGRAALDAAVRSGRSLVGVDLRRGDGARAVRRSRADRALLLEQARLHSDVRPRSDRGGLRSARRDGQGRAPGTVVPTIAAMSRSRVPVRGPRARRRGGTRRWLVGRADSERAEISSALDVVLWPGDALDRARGRRVASSPDARWPPARRRCAAARPRPGASSSTIGVERAGARGRRGRRAVSARPMPSAPS